MTRFYLIGPGDRPDWRGVAAELWGADCDIDSDGNDDEGVRGGWTELTISVRSNCEQRLDIDPLDEREPLVLVIRSDAAELAERASKFLQTHAGGDLSERPPTGREG